MMLNRMALGLSVALVFAGAGCGGDDPLTGTWSNATCFGAKTTPEGIKSCSTALTFTADLEFSVKTQQFSEPATATAPGCTTTRTVDGQTWSTDGTAFALEGTGKVMMERSSCVNATDEFKPMATADLAAPTGGSDYVISDKTLTIAKGPLAGAYTN